MLEVIPNKPAGKPARIAAHRAAEDIRHDVVYPSHRPSPPTETPPAAPLPPVPSAVSVQESKGAVSVQESKGAPPRDIQSPMLAYIEHVAHVEHSRSGHIEPCI